MSVLVQQQRFTILAGGLFRLCLVGCRFAQPLLVQAELDYTSDRATDPAAKGTWLVVGYAAVYMGIAVRIFAKSSVELLY